MFGKIIDDFYISLAQSIGDRKRQLKLSREKILNNPSRITEIIKHVKRNEKYPYMIGRTEYRYLYDLYQFEDKESFFKKGIMNNGEEIHKNDRQDFDKMLWGHINWNEMFELVILELSKLDSSNNLRKLFDKTLIDYVPFSIIKYDELNRNYGRIYICPEDRGRIEKDAIRWVHLRHGSGLFKKTFLEKFRGQTLRKFDDNFIRFVEEYLNKKKPNDYSFGLQAYNYHKTQSEFSAYWQSRIDVQYSDMYENEISEESKLLERYISDNRKQIQKLEEYQKEFDAFDIGIN